jgi:MFS family permease
MVAALMLSSTTSSGILMPRFGPRPLVPVGLIVAAGGLVILATQLGLHTSYPGQILPALLVIGLGLGTVFGCAMNTATYGADRADAGVASALVNTNQQVGGSVGTALLNTIAASALTGYVVAHSRINLTPATSLLIEAQAAVHSYVVAFWVSAAIFAGAAVVTGLVLASGTLALTAAPATPATPPAMPAPSDVEIPAQEGAEAP